MSIMQDETQAEIKVKIAPSPFRPGDDPAADLVLQTSDNVRFWLCKIVIARASPIFRDLFQIPHPPQGPDAVPDGPNSEYVDGKPVVRVAEDSSVVGPFMRCCYPLRRPALNAEQLTAIYEAGEKYDADVVRAYVQQEVARYASEEAYCLRAYLIAYRFDMTEEMSAAAKKTLCVGKDTLSTSELPEYYTVPAIALTQLQEYRKRYLDAVGEWCTPENCISLFEMEQSPMWEYNHDTACLCDVADEYIYGARYIYSHPSAGGLTADLDEDAKYTAKAWFCRYLWDVRKIIEKDDTTIRRALLDSDAMARAIQTTAKCDVCRDKVPAALTALLLDLEAGIDTIVWRVPFEKSRGKKRAHDA